MKAHSKSPARSRKKVAAGGTPEFRAIEDALKQALEATDVANAAAIHLNTQILIYRSNLASDSAIVRDTATLLAHVVQCFARTMGENTIGEPGNR